MDKPQHDVAALIAEVKALPNPDRCLLTHNEAELIRFCHRLGDALQHLAGTKQDGFEKATEGLMP